MVCATRCLFCSSALQWRLAVYVDRYCHAKGLGPLPRSLTAQLPKDLPEEKLAELSDGERRIFRCPRPMRLPSGGESGYAGWSCLAGAEGESGFARNRGRRMLRTSTVVLAKLRRTPSPDCAFSPCASASRTATSCLLSVLIEAGPMWRR